MTFRFRPVRFDTAWYQECPFIRRTDFRGYDPLPAITTDDKQLTQVFQNFVGNAIKYRSTEVPHVHVSATKNGKEWIFSVPDNGLGIDPQYFERIFIIFQRLHGQKEFKGTGDRIGNLQEGVGAAWRKDLGRVAARKWFDLATDWSK
jgi:signal transduction histidine kinase